MDEKFGLYLRIMKSFERHLSLSPPRSIGTLNATASWAGTPFHLKNGWKMSHQYEHFRRKWVMAVLFSFSDQSPLPPQSSSSKIDR